MSDLENGYYWVSYHGMAPVIMEKDSYGWNAMGIETEPDLTGYKILGRVSEWCSNENSGLHLQRVSGSTCFHRNRVTTHRGEHCVDCGKRF